MNRTARSVEELFPIVAFARAGDLKSVKARIDAGSPLNLPTGKKTRRQSPLQIAIQSGFLTLTEMLLDRFGPNQGLEGYSVSRTGFRIVLVFVRARNCWL